jgi:hypothetical protein
MLVVCEIRNRSSLSYAFNTAMASISNGAFTRKLDHR